MKSKSTKRAFTIVELVIVIAVIAILMSIMFVGGTALNNNAKMRTLAADLRTFEVNLKAAAQSADGASELDSDATVADIQGVLEDYFEDEFALTLVADADYTATEAISGTCFTEAKDPWGMPYEVEVINRSVTTVGSEKTNIVVIVKSYGKNQLTYNNGVDKDDHCLVMDITDSVVRTAITNEGYASYLDASDAAYTADILYSAVIIDKVA